MSAPLKILCVHGIGGQERNLDWQDDWRLTLEESVRVWSAEREVIVEFLVYDDLFAAQKITAGDVAAALMKLIGSGVWYGISDLFRSRTMHPNTRGLSDLSETARWTAGMVVQWAENDKLRKETRTRLAKCLREHQPDVIAAHSLGSLIAYDTLARSTKDAEMKGFDLSTRALLTFGSQIGNPFVRSTFGGRIRPLPVRRWFHLFNRHDDVFAAKIRIDEPGFTQVQTDFDIEGMADHDALEYLRHPATVSRAWRELAPPAGSREMRLSRDVERVLKPLAKKPRKRALLIGINDYPEEKDRLEGCVNDVFLMSSLLQENGYTADDIRVVLDKRATAAGILERLEWLLDGTEDGAERFLYYSGHGAQIPTYGANDKVDGLDECLVAWDFDWTRERAVTDDQFSELYSQLPYDARFVAVFDCCHSGGMSREGSAKVRGLTPPDDIRHRALRWESKFQMWVPRDLEIQNKDLSKKSYKGAYTGSNGGKRRFGRSVALRTLADSKFDRVRTELGHHGPYLPVILEACQEDQLAYEYRHGVVSHGAFTWSLVRLVRERQQARRKLPSFHALVREVSTVLETLQYDQRPAVVGPASVLKKPVPWS